MRISPWRNIWIADNPVEVLNKHLSLLVGRYEPTNVIRVPNKEAHLLWARDHSRVNREEFVRIQVRANETYSEAKRLFSDRDRDVLMNAHSPHKSWFTLKSVVFGSS